MRHCGLCVFLLLAVFATSPRNSAAQEPLQSLAAADDQSAQSAAAAALLAVDSGVSGQENQSPREARQFFFPFFGGGPVFYGRRRFYGGGGGFYGGRRFYGGGFGGRRGFYGRRRFG